MLKKALLALSIVGLLLTTTIPAQANASPKGVLVQTFNEYETWKHLKSLTDEQLLTEGFSKEDITEIREFDYATHIREVSELDDETLRAVRYTDEQIKVIREFDGSEEHLEILATTMMLWANYLDWYYSPNPSSESWVQLGISWAFLGVPGGTWTDKVVFSWSHSFRLDRSAATASVNYYYETVYGYWATQTVYPTPYQDTPGTDLNSAEFQIQNRKAINGLLCRALDGTATIRIWDFGPKNSINFFGSYGHRASLLALGVGWSFTSPPSVEIDWGGFWTHADDYAGTLNLYTGQIVK